MRTAPRFKAVILVVVAAVTGVSSLMTAGCGRREEPAKAGYYEGPMKPKGGAAGRPQAPRAN